MWGAGISQCGDSININAEGSSFHFTNAKVQVWLHSLVYKGTIKTCTLRTLTISTLYVVFLFNMYM